MREEEGKRKVCNKTKEDGRGGRRRQKKGEMSGRAGETERENGQQTFPTRPFSFISPFPTRRLTSIGSQTDGVGEREE